MSKRRDERFPEQSVDQSPLEHHPEGPDPKIDGDLLEGAQGDQPSEEALALPPRRRPVQLIIALVALSGLAALLLRPIADVVNAPSLSFLEEARELAEVPLIQELREASVLLHIERRGSRESALGSGFNVASDGVIVTNKHVVADAQSIAVTFRGRGTFPAANWITHPRADLAIVRLRTDAHDLPTVTIASGEPPLVGAPVYIIGNPLGIANTAVSGTLRSYALTAAADGMAPVVAMVLEAPIHPGSSGSPVFDEEGRVLGVVFAQLPKEEGLPDRGLAIPIAVLEDWLL